MTAGLYVFVEYVQRLKPLFKQNKILLLSGQTHFHNCLRPGTYERQNITMKRGIIL